jgi:hypothetical protein
MTLKEHEFEEVQSESEIHSWVQVRTELGVVDTDIIRLGFTKHPHISVRDVCIYNMLPNEKVIVGAPVTVEDTGVLHHIAYFLLYKCELNKDDFSLEVQTVPDSSIREKALRVVTRY